MFYEAAKDLLNSIEKFHLKANGDSGDAEHDAAVEMANAALAFVKQSSARNDVHIADLGDIWSERIEKAKKV
jgi:hypothetical protein